MNNSYRNVCYWLAIAYIKREVRDKFELGWLINYAPQYGPKFIGEVCSRIFREAEPFKGTKFRRGTLTNTYKQYIEETTCKAYAKQERLA